MAEIIEVILVADRDEIIRRVLLSVDNDVYFVCKREEFEAAQREGRDPVCVGFRREYVVDRDGKLKS